MPNRIPTRRKAVIGLAAVAAAAALPFVVRGRSTPLGYALAGAAPDRGLDLVAPRTCTPGTPSQIEGPYYTPSTPRRADLREPVSGGEPLFLQGLVLTPDCRPVPGAAIDLWHCDERGRYDNDGFRYRGHQFTDAAGAFRFATIRPGLYPQRAPHFHVKLQGRATRLLTTQLYFPDRPHDNIGDPIFREELLLRLDRAGGIWQARFDFVLPPA